MGMERDMILIHPFLEKSAGGKTRPFFQNMILSCDKNGKAAGKPAAIAFNNTLEGVRRQAFLA
jgi:hypothetical protein